jgi:pilus assembly protein Flp/PilA
MKRLVALRKCVVAFLTRREEGMSVVEYGLLLALLALVCVGALVALGSRINSMCAVIGGSL